MLLTVVAALLVLLPLALAPAGPARADARMTVKLEPATTPVPAGDHLSYNGHIECSIPGDCRNVTVTFTAPPHASGPGQVSRPYPPGVTDVKVNADGSVTVTYDSIPSGQSSQLTVSWPTEDYWTPPGDEPVTMTARAENGDGTDSTDTAEVEVTAVPHPTITKEGPKAAAPGDTVTYKITATNDPVDSNRPRGSLALENAVLTDVLPPGVTLVDATPADYTYDPATRTVTWPVDTEPGRPGNQFGRVTTYPYGVVKEIRVRIDDSAAEGTELTDTASVVGDPYGPGTTPVTTTDTATTSVGAHSGHMTGTLDKSVSTPLAGDGQRISYVLRFSNTSATAADAVLSDDIPAGFDASAVSLSRPDGSAYPGSWTVKVTRADGSTDMVTPSGQTADLSGGSRPTRVVLDVPGMAAGDALVAQIVGRADSDAVPGGSGTVHNCARLELTGASGSGETGDADSCADFRIEPEVSEPEVEKSTDPAPVGPGGTHTWRVTVRNDRYRTDSAPLRPRLVDLIPSQLTYDSGSFRLADGQPAYCPAGDRFTEATEPGPDGRTRLLLTAERGAEIPNNDSACRYEFTTTVKPGAAGGTYSGQPGSAAYKGNRIGLYDPQRPIHTRQEDTHDINGNGDTSEAVAEATDDFAIAQAASLFVSKEVRGDRDSRWFGSAEVPGKEEEFGRSNAGGTVSYRTVLGNLGNTPLTEVVAYDLLPAPGTPGVTSGRYGDRAENEWRPVLTGPVDAGTAPVTITYSDKDDPCRPELDNTPDKSAPFQCGGTVDPSFVPAGRVADWSRIRSIRFDFGGHVFAAGQRYTLAWTMKVPERKADGAKFTGGERTWNKIGIDGARRESDGSTRPLLATEAPWVVSEVGATPPEPTVPPTTPPTMPPTVPPTTPTTPKPTATPTGLPTVGPAVPSDPSAGRPSGHSAELPATGLPSWVLGAIAASLLTLVGGTALLIARARRS